MGMDIKEFIRAEAALAGFARVGFAKAEEVDSNSRDIYDNWIAHGRHAGMQYMERYESLRTDPRLLLDGALTVVSCAVAYPEPRVQQPHTLRFASYALGDDYHEVVRQMLFGLAGRIVERTGAEVRVCVDTAPIRERYWAVKAGLGFIGINNQLIIPGLRSRFFLGEILLTVPVPADAPCDENCGSCMACVRACPGGALDGNGGMDCSRCHSYLTIEHRGDIPEGVDLHGHLYGCDVCQDVCPHNRNIKDHDSLVPERLMPRQQLLEMTPEDIQSMTSGDYRRLSRHSAIRRAPLAQLIRNLRYIQKKNE